MKKLKNLFINKVNQTILSNTFIYKLANQLLTSRVDIIRNLYDYENIFIDVSIIAKNDNKTGIQRVVREIIYQFLNDAQLQGKLRFIVATKKSKYREVKLVDKQTIKFDISHADKSTPAINLTHHDLFFGLDLSLSIIPFHLIDFIIWRLKGVHIVWVVYDLLPIHHPQWFTENINNNFAPWLKGVLLTGNLNLCISQNVTRELNAFAQAYKVYPKLKTIRLGANFVNHDVNEVEQNSIINEVGNYVLMVGTLEPRKGHLDIIEAFEDAWSKELTDKNLVIVGKMGWKVDDVVQHIYNSKFYNKKLFWLNDLTQDSVLNKMYEQAEGVIIASYAEGYGLPLIEALHHKKPVLARDIDIFHEVARHSKLVSFFSIDNGDLGPKLEIWLKSINSLHSNNESLNDNYESWDWEDCKNDILKAFKDDE